MLSQIRKAVTQLVESALLVAGVRLGTEEPRYTTQPLINGVEIRRYGPRIAAETVVVASAEAARNAGFRRLAGYIFGDNHREQRIASTVSLAEQVDRRGGQKIAMTAPVAQFADGADAWTIRFYMPAKWTIDRLPTPDDERVRLVAQPAETLAVLRFTGDRSPDAVDAQTAKLRDALRATGFESIGPPTSWFYDPPWTLPFLRRNEVAIPVAE